MSGRKYTYSQLIDGSIRWAGTVRRLHPTGRATVAILAPNSPDFVLLFFGTLAADAVVSPINSTYTSGNALQDKWECQASSKDGGVNLFCHQLRSVH